MRCDVLIAGAGPTGLALALWLARLGIRARIVDKAPEPGLASRALAVQARTLELYHQLDLATDVVSRGLSFAAANISVRGVPKARLPFGELGKGVSPYPYVLIYPQDEHEQLLVARLAAAGISVERPCEVIELAERDDRITARLRHGDGSIETCDAAYLAGCDGAHSLVREALGIEFPGGTYDHLFYVADVEASGPTMNGELHAALDDTDFLVCFPLKGRTHARLVGTIRPEAAQRGAALGWADIDRHVIGRIELTIERVNWFSTYHVHHRVARRFRAGRAFLLGDAAHIHSPVGGQGMNTGIGDAVNLAWKLAAVVRGTADARILDSFEAERIPFARQLVSTTDRAFELVAAESWIASWVRTAIAPRALALVFRSARVRRMMFDRVSQIEISYRDSPLSEGRTGRVHAGDRLPWVPTETGAADNFAPLTSLDWQIHVYGQASAELFAAAAARDLPLHALPWTAAARARGLARDAAYLVRPDGYIALAASSAHAATRLERYLDDRGIRIAPAHAG